MTLTGLPARGFRTRLIAVAVFACALGDPAGASAQARDTEVKALGRPLEQLFRLDQRPAAISVVDYFENTTVVRLINGRARDDAGRKLTGERPALR
jgi:hypothetical protein